MLMADLGKRSKPDHPDKADLLKAEVAYTQLASFIDNTKNAYEENKDMVDIEKTLKDWPQHQDFPLVTPSRMLLRQDDVIINNQLKHLYVFNDMFIVAEIIQQKSSRRTSLLRGSKESKLKRKSLSLASVVNV